jgi:membrane protein implicated in regulation of membrane protease activity
MSADIIWGVAGLLLIIADVIFGTFFVMFLGAGALITATLLWTGVPLYNTAQWLTFSAVSTLGVLLLRPKLKQWFGPSSEERFEEHKGQIVVVVEDVLPGKTGKIKYRGAEWQGATNGDDTIQAGENAVITHLDGIVVYIRKK